MNTTTRFYRRKKRRIAYLKQWQSSEALSAGFGMLGWVAATIDYEISYSPDRSFSNCDQLPEASELRWLDVVLTIVAIGFLVQRHWIKRLWTCSKAQVRGHPLSLFLFKLAAEAFLLCIFPYPRSQGEVYVNERHRLPPSGFFHLRDVCYTEAEVLYALMFLRFFFVLRAAVNTSRFMDGHARLVTKPFRVRANMRFTLKAWGKAHSISLLLVLMLPTALLASLLIRVFERPYMLISHQDFAYYPNTVYYTYVSMTTLAYGDFYAWTQPGRLCSILIGVWGMGAFSIQIYMIDRALRISPDQLKAFRTIHRSRAAARLIVCFFLYVRLCKQLKPESQGVKASLRRLILQGRSYRIQEMKLSELHTMDDKARQNPLTQAHNLATTLCRLEDLGLVFTHIETKLGQAKSLEGRLAGVSALLARLEPQQW